MSITFPLSLPGQAMGIVSVPNFVKQEWIMCNIAAITRSPFTGSTEVQEFSGQWWECNIQLPPMGRAVAEQWVAFLNSIRGVVGSFMLPDALAVINGPLGVASGTPVIDGVGQFQTQTVNLKGFTAGVTGILKAGDWLSFGVAKEHLYKVQKDCNSDGSGKAVVDIFPAILEPTADDDIVSIPGAGQFKLVPMTQSNTGNGSGSIYTIDVAQNYGLAFSAIQDI